VKHQHLMRYSLAALWLLTAAISLQQIEASSAALLHEAGLVQPGQVRAIVIAGAGWDALLGLLMLLRPTRTVWALAGATVLGFTAMATWLTPLQWLHPYGPLLKNLPIAAMLWTLYLQADQ
jgi:hypothetical protein